MKRIFVCETCGSGDVFADSYSALNTDEVITYDDNYCRNCDEPCDVVSVDVADDFDTENDIYNLK